VGPPKEIEREIDDGPVVSADSGDPIDPSKTQIGLLIGEPLSREEYERQCMGPQPIVEVEIEGLPEDLNVSARSKPAPLEAVVANKPEPNATESEKDRSKR
jgi:hypothetical protein